MDRRFLTWLMLTTALCFLYLSMRPPPPNPAQQPNAAADRVPNDDPLMQSPQRDADGDDQTTSIEAREAGKIYPERLVTLGSMDPSKGYKLLVTLTSKGAGIEQAELIGRNKASRFQYRALEHRGGYIGHLGLLETISGLRIRTIPSDSPAALAVPTNGSGNLEVGDSIVSLAGAPLANRTQLLEILAKYKPGEKVELLAKRGPGTDAAEMAFQVTLGEAPLDVLRSAERATELVDGNGSRPSLRTTLASISNARIPNGKSTIPALQDTLDGNWETLPLEVPGGQGVEFRLPLAPFLADTGRPANLVLIKRFRLFPAGEENDGYLLDLETTIENQNNEDVTASFRQEGLAGLTLEGWWYSVKISPYMFSGAGQRDAIYNTPAENHQLFTTRQIADYALKNPGQPDKIIFGENEPVDSRSFNYIGIDSQYFNASILPHRDAGDALSNLRRAGTSAIATPGLIPKSKAQATNTSFWFDTDDEMIPAQGQISKRYQVFIGPKDTATLESHNLGQAIEYGWFPWIAKPLSAILHFFHMIIPNYGLSIVMLTVLVRGLMFPLGRKAAMNAQKMQELQPELKKINEKYKDNMEKRAKAMQEVYAKHNFKPLAGCLPMFIQLPIFIGLYRCLSVDISLRQEPLFPFLNWCSNLAGPDMLFEWSSWMPEFIAGRGTGWLGPYFNILPMVTVGLFLLQQKMLMPKATDEQTRMTQNMMQVMTLFMGVLFFKVPSGLCIYFITSSLWSLVERKLIKRMTPATATAIVETQPPEANTSRAKKARRAERSEEEKPAGKLQELMQMLEKPAVKSATQRGAQKPARQPKKSGKKKRN